VKKKRLIKPPPSGEGDRLRWKEFAVEGVSYPLSNFIYSIEIQHNVKLTPLPQSLRASAPKEEPLEGVVFRSDGVKSE
jgi:hypothetical protein